MASFFLRLLCSSGGCTLGLRAMAAGIQRRASCCCQTSHDSENKSKNKKKKKKKKKKS